MEISDKLKTLREKNNLRQADVADYLSVSRKTISGWENQRSFPDINSLVRLSKLYSISLDDLLDDEQMLEHYQEQDNHEKRIYYIFVASYIFNWIFLILGFLRYFEIITFIKITIPLFLLLFSIITITLYPYWDSLKNRKNRALGVIIVLTALVTCIIQIVIFESNLDTRTTNLVFITGQITGKLIFALILSTGTYCSLMLCPNGSKKSLKTKIKSK
ncbi:helix-turn-helix domain-containing protein [uncultured Rummeliibacillus sp.]|uniref:helix-turn-helix domain-containing protein n=1 Tax=uncultured Rummeliibacillus sp. TaxID=762292 RepID=UPI002613405B|nr:helix-turn-helix transcriptional regulator [uncultured Rummeliibacillus sp.]